jgi:Increased loss of mitochondrial DNA protein 1
MFLTRLPVVIADPRFTILAGYFVSVALYTEQRKIDMALINGNTIIRSLSLFHITIGFFFLTSPKTVADQSLVFVLGEAMKLVRLPNRRSTLSVDTESF